MTLEQIRMFVTLANTGSVAKAAENLHKTQPALSIAIKRLQQELGLTLVEKQQNRLQLTTNGRKLLRHFQYLLKQQTNIVNLAKHLSHGSEQNIRLVMDTLCSQKAIFDIFKNVQKRHTLTEFHISSVNQLGALQHLIEGNADIAICPWLHNFYEIADFDTIVFSRFEVMTVIHRDFIGKNKPLPKTVSELQNIPLLLPQTFHMAIDLEDFMGVVASSQIRTNELASQKTMLKNGMGWGYIPKHIISEELASGELLPLVLEDVTTTLEGEIRLVKLSNNHLGPVATELWDAFSVYATSK
jgi:DNA-binding transcriptional LysR family regulator